MRVYRKPEDVPANPAGAAVTIGNFDGVHIGHRQIFRRLKALANAHGWTPTVLTFDPHPALIVAPERAPRLMTTLEQRLALMAQAGIEQILVLSFTREVSLLSPGEFVERLLAERLSARAVLVGDNFRFGHRQAGNAGTLTELGRRFGFITEAVPAVTCRGQVVSSSAIRNLVQTGRVSRAARFLGRPYSLEGEVVSGRGVGSKQTVPTLNLSTTAEVIPARGVYVTRTHGPETGAWNSITNAGYRPTFGASDELSIETFLLEPLTEDTPDHIRIEFLARVRDERKFDNPEALKSQILRDVGSAKSYFRRVKLQTSAVCRPATS